jgi:N-ethylmaleimide reductase
MRRELEQPWNHPYLGPLQSRVVMSAMTRDLADSRHAPTAAMAAYYGRRAANGVGLILTEGTIVDPSGDGYRSVPRICNRVQVNGWRRVTDEVHSHGSRIFCQLWHCGRISHPEFLGGQQPVSSTDRAAEGINRRNGQPYGVPRRLRTTEMTQIYDMFRQAAERAMDACFDGVELHLAHGYLPDQFFDGRVNDRTDAYGGSVQNRCRFGLELTESVLDAIGADRVMVRLSPSRYMGGLYEWPDLDEMLLHLIPAFDALGLRMLDISCADADYFETSGKVIRRVRPLWPHFLIGGASLPLEVAQRELDAGLLDMVTYGRLLIANPDLVLRFRRRESVVLYDRDLLEVLQ